MTTVATDSAANNHPGKTSAVKQPPDAKVCVSYEGLPKESREYLEELVKQWNEWHLMQYGDPERTQPSACGPYYAGSLQYTPLDSLLVGGALVWGEVLCKRVYTGKDPLSFNVRYEQDEAPPRYERASDAPLAEDTTLSAGGRAVFSRRSERRSLGSRCFNCGSYGHTLHECFRPRDQWAIQDARQALTGGRKGPQGGFGAQNSRYFNPMEDDEAAGAPSSSGTAASTPGSAKKGTLSVCPDDPEVAGLQPGKMTVELRQAMGLGPDDPPPWLHRMRAMGIPPAYRASEAAADGSGGVANGAGTSSASEQAVEFPGVNAPLPIGADPFRWGVGLAPPMHAPMRLPADMAPHPMAFMHGGGGAGPMHGEYGGGGYYYYQQQQQQQYQHQGMHMGMQPPAEAGMPPPPPMGAPPTASSAPAGMHLHAYGSSGEGVSHWGAGEAGTPTGQGLHHHHHHHQQQQQQQQLNHSPAHHPVYGAPPPPTHPPPPMHMQQQQHMTPFESLPQQNSIMSTTPGSSGAGGPPQWASPHYPGSY